jgi:hypothetical protein
MFVCEAGVSVRLDGDAVRENAAAALTFAVKLIVCEMDPLVPTAVIVLGPTATALEAAMVKY